MQLFHDFCAIYKHYLNSTRSRTSK